MKKIDNKIIDISYFNRARYFSLTSAAAILPIIIKVTRNATMQIKLHDDILQHCDLHPEFLKKVRDDKEQLKIQWHQRLEQLGAQSNDFGVVLFDTGYGYFIWRFPQPCLQAFISYDNMDVEQSIESVQYTHPLWLSPPNMEGIDIHQDFEQPLITAKHQQSAQSS